MAFAKLLRDLWVLTKPRQTLLLLITLAGGYFAAGGCDPLVFAAVMASGFLAIAGTTAMNMVLERDIDALMPRTAVRPIASGSLDPEAAGAFSIALLALGVVVASAVSPLYTAIVLLGYFFDILVYTNIAKRVSMLNILLGGVAGGLPALGGWVAARGAIEPGGVVLGALVMSWIPMHIWFIASYYLDDYRKAGIPMAPVVIGEARAALFIEASILAMISLGWAFPVSTGYGFIAASVNTVLGVMALRSVEAFRRKPSRETAFAMFKFASPMLAVFFVAAALEACIHAL